jgi:hypothetical protein
VWTILLRVICLSGIACVAGAAAARADAWLPHPAGARWTYHWSDSRYNPIGTDEAVTVDSADAPTCGWHLQWTGVIEVPAGSLGGAGASPTPEPDAGTMCFEDEIFGLVNTNWAGVSPPTDEPPLCVPTSEQCANSLGSVLYNVIWGSRSPVVSEPLLRGTSWAAKGGGAGEVTSQNTYLGLQEIKVPAFPDGIRAAAVRSQLALAGTPGDGYGSGTRTTWWAYGVGPVKLVFDHVDGSVTRAELTATDLVARRPRPDQNYFPMTVGLTGTYEWTNAAHLPEPEVERVSVAAAVNASVRMTVKSVSGPIRAAGDYVFALRLDGLRTTYGSTAGATLLTLPRLGHGVHFFTPLDLMTYGFNPVLPAYPVTGARWTSGNARDLAVFGVRGSTRVIGVRTVRVRAGRFQALEVRSVLTQPGHRYGSGVRTMWFSPTQGLVKLVFRHRDGSVSTVQLIQR